MSLVVALVGLVVGNLLNILVAHQVVDDQRVPPRTSLDWVPVLGALGRRDLVSLAVELLTATMAVVLVTRYGPGIRGLFLFGASLVLINTGAVDFKIRMIDTLVMVVATLLALALAPINELDWPRAFAGLVLAGGMFLLFFWLAKKLFPRDAVPFGLGDVYLAAFIGALAGFYDLPAALFYGMGLAGLVAVVLLLLRATGKAVPRYISYGTYLCLGALLFLAGGN